MRSRIVVAFDMDGTIADLYGVENWLPKLLKEDVSPYLDCKPLVNMNKLNSVCGLLRKSGYEIQVITAMCKGASPQYKKAIKTAKKQWLKKYNFTYDYFYGVDYKTNKSKVLGKGKDIATAILVDDEKRHIDKWKWGKTINPTETDLIAALAKLI